MTKLDNEIKPVPQDWHPAQVVAAIWMAGTSLIKLSRLNGYASTALTHALRRPWPKGERLIADAIHRTPQELWPSRYHADGSPKSGRGERGLGRHKPKGSTLKRTRNVQVKEAA